MTESPPAAEADAAALFEQHGASLYRFARVLLHNAEDAEDAVQTAFVRLIQHLDRGGDDTNLRAWLFTVTANAARDRLRRRRRWLPFTAAPVRKLIVAPELDLRDPQHQFLAAVQGLAPRDRLLLALRAQGLSYREIAHVADIKPTSVGQLLARALSRWQEARARTSVT